jgi:hypothetical protein
MPDRVIPNAAKAHLAVPPGAKVNSVVVRVMVQPATGAVLIYGGPGYTKPVRFKGPQSEGEVPTKTAEVYVQGADGVVGAQVYTLGWYGD